MVNSARRNIFVSGIDRLLAERAQSEAVQATDQQPAWTHGGYAITAIILAVSGLEAHIGEWLARPRNRNHFDDDELKAFRKQAGYEVLKAIVKKRSADYDFNRARWYQSLVGLHQLRNHVVHYFPEKRETGTFPPDLEPYIRNGTFSPIGNDGMDWTSRLLVKPVAEQSVRIAADAQREFDQALDGWT